MFVLTILFNDNIPQPLFDKHWLSNTYPIVFTFFVRKQTQRCSYLQVFSLCLSS